ncbi:type IV secretory system conjugative DNA transfer family protein [Agarilytica rhodophyticola]|uniref:type IV secretory system conjugative DNA transfer family protein n=1 Tax=Agarilytica rhodophyticola TaxID=1737490 RepID=UPI000B3436DB|nr:type IV secretory system conjugative DNA transfer family protein [Agarilytica rhodophyticola]
MNNANERYGSADLAKAEDLEKAGLLNNNALPMGFTDEAQPRQIGFDADTPILVVGSAGTGKQTTLISYQLLHPEHTVVLDMKGESYAISAMMQAFFKCYGFNPYGLFTDKPWYAPTNFKLNPLDVIEQGSASKYEECMSMAQNLIAKPSGGDGTSQHFYGKAVQILTAILVVLKDNNNHASLVDVYHVVGDIRTEAFEALHYPAMIASPYHAVRQVAEELLTKQSQAPAEFESIMSTVSNALQILGSPALQMALSSPSTITPQEFCASEQVSKLFLMIPAHLVEACAPVIRCIFASLTIAQQRKPTQRIHLLLDEAGQLGNFDAMPRMFSYGRGSKSRVSAYFQNIGQGLQHYGKDGFDTIFSNAQTKLILGVSSKLSAEMISDYLGQTTYEYYPKSKSIERHAKQVKLMHDMLKSGDVLPALPEIQREHELMDLPEAVKRPLITPDELIRMPPDKGLMAFQGLGIHPYVYKKIPYFKNPNVAHKFLPNPYHPPFDKVTLPKGLWGKKTVPIISEPVPNCLSHLPQYSSGMWSYPKGYPPYTPSLWQRLKGKR